MQYRLYAGFKSVGNNENMVKEMGRAMHELADLYGGIWCKKGDKFSLIIPCQDASELQSFLTSVDFVICIDEIECLEWAEISGRETGFVVQREVSQ